MNDEIWKEVPGYEGYYDVSNHGRIRSWYRGGGHRRKKPYLKKIQADKDGYPFVLLYKDGGRCQGFRVSRLVLHAFVRAPVDGEEASHKDGDNTNNYLGNLIWETRLQNEQRKRRHGTRPIGEDVWSSKLTAQEVRKIRKLRKTGKKLRYLSDLYDVTESTISKICRGGTWAHV